MFLNGCLNVTNLKHIEYLFLNPGTGNWLSYEDARDQGWNGPGWYFWDETEAYCHGPWKSAKEAEKELKKYALSLDN